MARTRTIQIRLTEVEHATIASQAELAGLGVGTWMRAQALSAALQSSATPAGKAFRTLLRAQERSASRGLDKLSLDEIDSEVRAARKARRRK